MKVGGAHAIPSLPEKAVRPVAEVLTEWEVIPIFPPQGHPSTKDSMTTVKETMMTEMNLARLRAHRNNIQRYRRLLSTQLSELERTYILTRLRDEELASEALVQSALPIQHLAKQSEQALT